MQHERLSWQLNFLSRPMLFLPILNFIKWCSEIVCFDLIIIICKILNICFLIFQKIKRETLNRAIRGLENKFSIANWIYFSFRFLSHSNFSLSKEHSTFKVPFTGWSVAPLYMKICGFAWEKERFLRFFHLQSLVSFLAAWKDGMQTQWENAACIPRLHWGIRPTDRVNIMNPKYYIIVCVKQILHCLIFHWINRGM